MELHHPFADSSDICLASNDLFYTRLRMLEIRCESTEDTHHMQRVRPLELNSTILEAAMYGISLCKIADTTVVCLPQ